MDTITIRDGTSTHTFTGKRICVATHKGRAAEVYTTTIPRRAVIVIRNRGKVEAMKTGHAPKVREWFYDAAGMGLFDAVMDHPGMRGILSLV